MSTKNKNEELVDVMDDDMINRSDIYKGRYQDILTKYLGKVIRPIDGKLFARDCYKSTDANVEFLITGFDLNGFDEIGHIIGHTVKVIEIPEGCKWEVPEDKTEYEEILFSNIYRSVIIEGHEREIKVQWAIFDKDTKETRYKRCVPFGAGTDGFSSSYKFKGYAQYAGSATLDKIMVDNKGEIYYKIDPMNYITMRMKYDEIAYYMEHGVNGTMVGRAWFECSTDERLVEMQKMAESKLEEVIKSRSSGTVSVGIKAIRNMTYYSNIFPESDECFDDIFVFDMRYSYADYLFYSIPAMFIGQLRGTRGKLIIFEKGTGKTTDIDVDITSKYLKTTPYVDGKERLSNECLKELEW